MIRRISQAKAQKTSSLFPAYCRPSRGWKPGVIWGDSSGTRGNPSHGGAAPGVFTLPANCCCHARGCGCCGRSGSRSLLLRGCPWPGSAAAAAPQGASRQPPRPAPCPAPLPALAPRRFLSAAGHLDTSGGPGRAAPAAPDRAPTPGSRSGLPRGSPGPLLLPSGSRPALPRLASPPPTCCAGSGPEGAGGVLLWYCVCVYVCVCIPTGDRDVRVGP